MRGALRAGKTGQIAGRGYLPADEPIVLAFGIAAGIASVLIFILYLSNEAFRNAALAAPLALWAFPPVLMLWIGRIWILAGREELHDDPVAFAVKDRVSYALGAIAGIAFLIRGNRFAGRVALVIRRQLFQGEVARFLIAGGSAALINWLARIGLSQVVPLDQAIFLAYGIGMVAGFLLYRSFVFEGADGSLLRQIALFLGVNLIGAVVVLAATMALKSLLVAVMPELGTSIAEALAHGAAIGIGAVSNYLGHRLLTFRSAEALQSR